MSQDNPDTIMIQDSSHWESTQVEDVFLPSVRVQLAWIDIEEAVANGAVVPAEAHSLWATWAMPGAPTRVSNLVVSSAPVGAPLPGGPAAASRVNGQDGTPPLAQPGEQAPRPRARAEVIGWLVGGLVAGLVLGCGLMYLALA